MQNKSKKSAVRSLAVMVLFLLIAIGLVVELLRIYVPNVWAAFSSGNENALQTWFDGQSTAYSAGLLWLLSFVQILSVVLPAMPVQLVAGIVLGPWLGCAVCLTACMAAHIAVFYDRLPSLISVPFDLTFEFFYSMYPFHDLIQVKHLYISRKESLLYLRLSLPLYFLIL